GALVFPFAAGRFAPRFQLVGRAVAIVCVPVADQSRRERAIAVEAFGLKVRSVRPADLRTFVPLESEPPHAVEDPFHHFVRRSLDVGVCEAQHEHAAVAAGEEPVEERGARTADMQVTGRRGSEADAEHAYLVIWVFGEAGDSLEQRRRRWIRAKGR